MNQPALPRARKDCLLRKLDDELLIYDPQRHEGHCLNSTAAAVWRLCDGKNSPLNIAGIVSRQLLGPGGRTNCAAGTGAFGGCASTC
jgi:hypothetical protein